MHADRKLSELAQPRSGARSVAHGVSHGIKSAQCHQPRRGETSTENIFRIIVDAMLDQKLNELFLKRSFAVMRFLPDHPRGSKAIGFRRRAVKNREPPTAHSSLLISLQERARRLVRLLFT